MLGTPAAHLNWKRQPEHRPTTTKLPSPPRTLVPILHLHAETAGPWQPQPHQGAKCQSLIIFNWVAVTMRPLLPLQNPL